MVFRCRAVSITIHKQQSSIFVHTEFQHSYCECIVRSLALCPQYMYMCELCEFMYGLFVSVCLASRLIIMCVCVCVRAEMAYRHRRHTRNYKNNNKYNVNGRAQQCAKDGQQ